MVAWSDVAAAQAAYETESAPMYVPTTGPRARCECGADPELVPTYYQDPGLHVCALCRAYARGGAKSWLSTLAALDLQPSDVPAPRETVEALPAELAGVR